MNKFEFKEVIDYFKGIKSGTTNNRYNDVTDVFNIGPISLYYSGSYYTIVKGKIEASKAIKIFDNYDNNIYCIRVDGGGFDWKPLDHLVDDIYKRELEVYQMLDEENRNKVKEDFLKRDIKNKYLECYHVDTLEGLIILINEVLDMNLDYKEVYKDITKRLIYKCFDLKKEINLDKVVIASMNKSHNELKNKCRELIKEFDSLIFPFNKDVDSLLDNFNIKIDKKEENEIKIYVDDNSFLAYGYNDNTFSYRINYIIDDDIRYFFSHYIRDNKEYFVVLYSSRDDYLNLTYNLTDDKVSRKCYTIEEEIEDKDYELLNSELNNALYILNYLVFNKEECKIKKI